MSDSKWSWQATISILLIVLLLATTLGMVWHHHDQCSASNCTLCHLVIGPPSAPITAMEMLPVTAEHAVLEIGFASVCNANEKPPRAPPV
jgi:hypothetical protein